MPHKPFAKSNVWSFMLLGAAIIGVMYLVLKVAIVA